MNVPFASALYAAAIEFGPARTAPRSVANAANHKDGKYDVNIESSYSRPDRREVLRGDHQPEIVHHGDVDGRDAVWPNLNRTACLRP